MLVALHRGEGVKTDRKGGKEEGRDKESIPVVRDKQRGGLWREIQHKKECQHV